MATKKEMDLLTAMEEIVLKAKDSGLSKEFYRKADRYISYVAKRMELTKEQAVMLAMFVDNSDESCIRISDFCQYLECRTPRILRYMSDIDELVKREFVRCRREDCQDKTYSVPMEVIEAFKNNETYVPKSCTGLSCFEFFGELETIFKLREHKELTYDATVEKVKYLFEHNAHLLYVQKVNSYAFNEMDWMMLVLFTHLFVNNDDDSIRLYDLDFLFDIRRTWLRIKMYLEGGCHVLQRTNLIEFCNENGLADRSTFRMTMGAKRELLSELNLSVQDNRRGDMVKYEEITPKNLYYGEKVNAQISELGNLLDDEHYQQVCTRMKKAGFRCGFTCLFYGAPGTGKTETVLQLARQAGRDILQVNISQIKSMWVGESEKNIKQVFDHYRTKVKESPKVPILLFNEADAIIGKRQEGATRAVEKMENSVQNIILQEMETLDGILIATTNLAQNMDKAFERRFLYKIKFDKPTVEARMSIWHEMIPRLNEEEARVMASKYDFSGGQIENIARHYAISNILHGETDNVVEELSSFCDGERLDSSEKPKIGFN